MDKEKARELGNKMRRAGEALQTANAECDSYDKNNVAQAIGLLNSMVAGGEAHTETSRAVVRAALDALRAGPSGPQTAIELVAAERARQKVGIPCWECKGSGKGREYLNHQDNTPTGRYSDCWRCHGTKVAGFDAKHDDNTNSGGQLAWAAVCYAAPDTVYRLGGGGEKVTLTDPWPNDWDRSWDKRKKRPIDANIRGHQLELRVRELVKAGALVVAELERHMRILEDEDDG